MDVALLAHKNLDNLHGYTKIENQEQKLPEDLISFLPSLDRDEKIIGFYTNQFSDRNYAIVTNQKMIVKYCHQYNEIKYSDIEKCYMEADKKSTNLFIQRKNKNIDVISIDGVKEGKFLDVYGFLRFIKKIIINMKLTESVSVKA
jgi:hypothetical protein